MKPKRLHLGCFDRGIDSPEWLNTDVTPHLFVARVPFAATLLHAIGAMPKRRLQQHRDGVWKRVRYLDVGKRFPFPDSRFECAFSSHVLEHLGRDEALRCAKEVRRVLQPGGVFRVVVPDLQTLVSAFDPVDPNAFLTAIYEPDQRGKNAHKWMYTEASLAEMLRAAGFSRVVRRSYLVGMCPDLDVLDNRPDSLFIEATL